MFDVVEAVLASYKGFMRVLMETEASCVAVESKTLSDCDAKFLWVYHYHILLWRS